MLLICNRSLRTLNKTDRETYIIPDSEWEQRLIWLQHINADKHSTELVVSPTVLCSDPCTSHQSSSSPLMSPCGPEQVNKQQSSGLGSCVSIWAALNSPALNIKSMPVSQMFCNDDTQHPSVLIYTTERLQWGGAIWLLRTQRQQELSF